ncbi:MAG TPA: hypothetical protein VFG20_15535 [Planctomycetaceae bacterium]|nr:hypothetical protein [Planctomycetaceae bacterium]
MNRRGMQWIVAAVIALVGCGRIQTDRGSIAADSNKVANDLAAVSDSKAVEPNQSPAIRRRSPEALRQRIRDTVSRMQADAPAREQRQRLQRVAKAVLQYEEHNGALPADSEHLSWRVAVLPFLDEDRLARNVRWNEPWNSAHNESIAGRMPKAFGDDPLGLTRCFLMTEANTPVLLIEADENSEEVWTKPAESLDLINQVPRRIALRDGTVAEVDGDVPLTAWNKWLSAAPSSTSSTPSWLRRVPPPTVVQPVADIDTNGAASFRLALPRQTWCAISIQPQRLLRNPHMHAMYQGVMAEAASPTALESLLGRKPGTFRTDVEWMQQRGIDPARLESLTVIYPDTVWTGPVVKAEMAAVAFRASGPFDVEGLLQHEMELTPGYQFREQGASAGIIHFSSSHAWQFMNDQTLLWGGQELVASVSEAQPTESRLAAAWNAASDAPMSIVLDCRPVQPLIQQWLRLLPPALQEGLTSLRTASDLTLTVDPDSSTWTTMTVTFSDDGAAAQVQRALIPAIDEERARLAQRDQALAQSVRDQSWVMLINGLHCAADGSRLRITVARPENWEAWLQTLLTRVEQKS